MTYLKCEGLKFRVDDIWAGDDNGKLFYLDLNLPINAAEQINDDSDMGDLIRFAPQLIVNGGGDFSGELKDKIIVAAIQLLEKQKQEGTRPKGRTAELVSKMTGISKNYVYDYLFTRKHYLTKHDEMTPEEEERRTAVKSMKCIRKHLRYLLENLDAYQWEEFLDSLGTERELAEALISKLQETIVEGDEKMKKVSVDYLLEDNQCDYLGRIHDHYPGINEEDLFMMIMLEGSALDIDRKLRNFCREHGIQIENSYGA